MKKTVTLKTPIKNGDKEITTLELRTPKAGEMRGLKTMDLLQMDITAHRTLLPRICPELTAAMFDDLEAENLTAIQSEVTSFFLSADV